MSYIPKCEVLLVILSVLALTVLLKTQIDSKFLKKLKPVVATVLIVFPIYCFFASYCFESLNSFNYRFQGIDLLFMLAMFFIYIASLFIIGLMINKKHRLYYIFSIVFAVFTAGYMLLLNPINSRAFFYSYVLLSVCGIILFQNVLKLININKKYITQLISMATVAIMLFLIPLHVSICGMDKIVNEYISYQVEQGETEVTICNLTDSEYFHHSYSYARLGYVYYQKEPKDVKFNTVSITDWLNNYYKNGDYKESK